MQLDKFVVWRHGQRWVNYGRIVDENWQIVVVEITTVDGENHHVVLPKGSMKFKRFDTEKEAKEFLDEHVH